MTEFDLIAAVRHGRDAYLDVTQHMLDHDLPMFRAITVVHRPTLRADVELTTDYDAVAAWAASLGDVPVHEFDVPPHPRMGMNLGRSTTGTVTADGRSWLVRVTGQKVQHLAPVDDHPAPSYITHQQRHDAHTQPRSQQ